MKKSKSKSKKPPQQTVTTTGKKQQQKPKPKNLNNNRLANVKDVTELEQAEEEFAYEPTFLQFLFRGFVFDMLLIWFKLVPLGLLGACYLFWLVNEFDPVYESMSRSEVTITEIESSSGNVTSTVVEEPLFFQPTLELINLGAADSGTQFQMDITRAFLNLALIFTCYSITIPFLFVLIKWTVVNPYGLFSGKTCNPKELLQFPSGPSSLFSSMVNRHFFV